jgi:iron-sulfur cluster assembly protein
MISFTPSAMKAVKRFVATSADPVAGLRILVSGGGCAGLQYGLRLEPARHNDDVVVEVEGVTVLVDPLSAPLLEGVKVDFVDSLSGSGFKFDNPRASHACACGQSFTA